MFHFGVKPIPNIKKDISNIRALQRNILDFPEPINNHTFLLENFNDCFEVALLRFVQIIFGDSGKINLDKVKKLIGETYNTNQLFNFLQKNNKIFSNIIPTNVRLEWMSLLSEKNVFNYKIENKFLVQPIPENVLNFFTYFFPTFRYEGEKIFDNFNELFKFLNFNCKVYKDGWITKEKIYEETTIKIFIDGNNLYDWQFYQYYDNINNQKGKIITGYCELKYSVYINKIYKSINNN
jgi:hypothetical protein